MWTQIRLQPNLDQHCLTKDLLKHFSRRQKQTTFVEIGDVSDVENNDQDSCKLKDFFLH